jgi:putative DNA primase/helicase
LAAAQIVPLWYQHLQPGRGGLPSANEYNVVIALREAPEWQGVFAFDEFHHRLMVMKTPPWAANGHDDYPRTITDSDEAQTLLWMQQQDIRVKISAVQTALKAVLHDHRFHPLQDYLNSLKWDGVLRIEC